MTYPTIRPELTLDFANSRQLDPRITFSRTSGATYLNPDTGLITLASEHEPRFEKDGLLIEEKRTNSILNTSTPNASNWDVLSGGETPVNSTSIAPDGTTGCIRIQSTVELGGGKRTFTPSVTGDHICSVWARSRTGTAQNVRCTLSDTFGPDVELPADGKWVRTQSDVEDVTAITGKTFGIRAIDSSGCDIDVWGEQAEAGAFPTSFIPTGSQIGGVIREADICTIKGNEWLNIWTSDNHSIFAEGTINYTVSNTTFPAGFAGPNLYTLDGRVASWNKVWYSYVEDGGRGTIDGTGGGGGAVELFHAVTQKTGTFKSCLTFDTNNDRIISAWNTVLSGSPAAGNYVDFWRQGGNPGITIGGKNTNNRTAWNGTVARIAIYNAAMPDEQLQTITL